MSSEPIKLNTPVGRVVQGHPVKGNHVTDEKTGQAVLNRDGSQQIKWFFALAIPKTDPTWQTLYSQILNKAKADMPHGFGPDGQPLPHFSLKISDGDSTTPMKNGSIPNQKEGWAGHWIMKFTTTLKAPGLCDTNNQELAAVQVKCGDWVEVYASCKGNDRTDSPGIYLNPLYIKKVREDVEISTSVTAAEAFGGAPAAPAVQATPITPVATPPVAQGPAAGAPAVQPAPDFLQGPPAVQAGPPAIPPIASPDTKYQHPVNKQWYTRAELLGAGVTDEQINNLPTMGV